MDKKDAEEKNADEASMVLTINGEAGPSSLKVLRPVHPRDCLWAAFNGADIALLINVMRSEGFDPDLSYNKSEDLPKGIHARKDFYVVRYRKTTGQQGFKSFKSLQGAVDFQQEADSAGSSFGSGDSPDESSFEMSIDEGDVIEKAGEVSLVEMESNEEPEEPEEKAMW